MAEPRPLGCGDVFFPLPWSVTRLRRVLTDRVDALGNEIWDYDSDAIDVAGWSAPSSAEEMVSRHSQLRVDLILLAPVGEFEPHDEVYIDPYGWLSVDGWPANYSHGPFGWDPGLEVVSLRKVESGA